ncbi:probable G-protein coupled receptor 139 [Heterodontus francisci]|uniref:probable G-protein coupled receptor 139 n=1 Tax=Heterodontus francisci TaxID=7792 RepID=UPI00355B288E
MDRTIDSILKIYYPFLAVIGVPVNLLAIVILSRGKCGLSTCTTRYLVAMAIMDLLLIITEIILWRIRYHYFPGSFLNITPVCSVNIVLLRAATDCSVWFTVTFTFDRFVAICCQKLKSKYCTKKTAAVVLATTCILLCSKNIPFYFRYEPGEIIDNFDDDSRYIIQQVGYMLHNLSCCTNTFIYVVTQSKFREQVKSAVKYPVTSIIQLMNK